MSALLYAVAWLAIIACVAIIVIKVMGYLKKPMHLRWEIYPVPHETEGRAAYGGSYLEKTDWYKEKPGHDVIGMLGGFLKEALLMHASMEHNRSLWVRTYPFHLGLYALIGSLFLTILLVILPVMGGFTKLLAFLAGLASIVGFAGVLFGSVSLILRRLNVPDLKKFSMPEHYFNLVLFAVWSALGLILCLTYGVGGFTGLGILFFHGMFTFDAFPFPALYALYLLISCFIFVWVPYSFMGHVFMKYFTWHDIRWDDTAAQFSPKIQAKMMENLGRKPTWSADHIKGDGNKTWADIATKPVEQEDKE